MESDDVILLALAVYRDIVEKKLADQFKEEYHKLLVAEVDSRRMKSSELIKQMAIIKIKLFNFETVYSKVKEKTGKIEAVDHYIYGIKQKLKKLSYEKNNLKKQKELA